VRDLEAVVDAIEAPRFALLGISQGAAVAIAYAVAHPERVSHLVLHGAYARGRLVRANTPEMHDEAETDVRLAELGWGKDDPSFRQFFTTQFIPGGTPEQHRWFNEMERISTSPQTAARFMREFNAIDVTASCPRCAARRWCCTAATTCACRSRKGGSSASAIPGARFVPIESSNHLLLEASRAGASSSTRCAPFLPAGAAARRGAAGAFEALSKRQREILELVAQGRDNAQIAAALGLTDKTVRNQVSAIFDRLGSRNRPQAIVLAREAGLGRRTRSRRSIPHRGRGKAMRRRGSASCRRCRSVRGRRRRGRSTSIRTRCTTSSSPPPAAAAQVPSSTRPRAAFGRGAHIANGIRLGEDAVPAQPPSPRRCASPLDVLRRLAPGAAGGALPADARRSCA
jgi:DNA-binding CsgD family transcriptional regulator